MVELGISTFGETTEIEGTGVTPAHDERIRDMIEEMKLADEVGLDLYAIGEHHRKDLHVSAPEILLAAGAAVTKNIKLSSAVNSIIIIRPSKSLSTICNDRCNIYGRAEIMVGRGSLQNTFPFIWFD